MHFFPPPSRPSLSPRRRLVDKTDEPARAGETSEPGLRHQLPRPRSLLPLILLPRRQGDEWGAGLGNSPTLSLVITLGKHGGFNGLLRGYMHGTAITCC